MKVKKYVPIVLLVMGILMLIASILLFIFCVGSSEGFRCVMFVLIALLLIVDGILLLLLATKFGRENPNFFLYDRATEKNMDIRDLTFNQINTRMTLYMRQISTNARQMWNENLLAENKEEYGENGLFKPLIVYKMLYDLVAVGKDNDDVWFLFIESNPEVIKSMKDALTANGDSEMGDTLIYLRENSNEDSEKIKLFITENIKYIQGKMLKYVKLNIDKFVS